MRRENLLADGERASVALSATETAEALHPPLGLSEAIRRLSRADRGVLRDVRVPLSAIQFSDGHVRVDSATMFALRPIAAHQLIRLATRARSPSRVTGDELRASLRRERDQVVRVRIVGDQVRAVLGSRFEPADDTLVFERLAAAVDQLGLGDVLRARFVAMSETLTVVRATLVSGRVDIRHGDPFEPGIEIVNCEVGTAALALRSLVWRSGCWNYSIRCKPIFRSVHLATRARSEPEWPRIVARALVTAGAMLEAWRSSPRFEEANELTAHAQRRPLTVRLREERAAQALVDGRTPA